MRVSVCIYVSLVLRESVVQAFAPARPVTRRARHVASSLSAAASDETPEIKPDILEPFPPATDPMYSVRGSVGEGDFVVTRSGGPVAEELTNENLLKILMIECSDLEVGRNDTLEVSRASAGALD